ncbi:hypothetical protein PICMEDRAFT_102618 [Pichia membranifaciens NRRL Y-2026]|uniref:Uncharacterized protein n=1 Tax=Pichia membranifaciens NRRL Y-2026 TaxID=763406 RepID=A0A1E3NUZ8_9ASCO|nr:hypothetical protein PICMEDRAFT_102618 [Pichia membranifaciens NRRL Y-2026]ODQ49488.1 hypothetical protein PICMEDRAFT_102618 [Pichia membranifaciens NRRL Y-2026]
MQDMLVKPGIQELLKYNDMLLYQQQVKILSSEFSNDLSILLYVLYYILFIYDESVLCFFLRCFMQLVLSYVMSPSNGSDEMIPGLSRLNISRLSGVTGTNSTTAGSTVANNNGNEPGRSGDANNELNVDTIASTESFDDIEALFSRWTVADKVKFVQKILLCLAVGWGLMIVYQLAFCLDDTYGAISYSVFGSLNKSIRQSAYSNKHYANLDQWSSENAFTTGSVLLNMIGETKLRSKFMKFFTIIMLDCFIITIQLIEVLLNYIVGFGIVERITEGANSTNDPQREYDGRQGRTTILKLNPFEAFGKL